MLVKMKIHTRYDDVRLNMQRWNGICNTAHSYFCATSSYHHCCWLLIEEKKYYEKLVVCNFLLPFYYIIRGCCPSSVAVDIIPFYFATTVEILFTVNFAVLFYIIPLHPLTVNFIHHFRIQIMSSPLLKKRKVANTHQKTPCASPCAICSKSCDEKQKHPDAKCWEEFQKNS